MSKTIKSGLKYIIFLGICFLLSFSWTCKRTVSPGYTDVDAIKDYIITHPSIFLADVFNTDSTDPDFYREITKRDNWIKIDFRDPDSIQGLRNAYVNWDDSIEGVFHHFVSGNEYDTSFKAFSRVKAYFEQWGDAGDIYRGWRHMKISNVEIYSLRKPQSVGINYIWVDTSGSDRPVNLSGLYDLNNVLQFKNSAEITFTIQVGDMSDFYFLHIYEVGRWKKIRFKEVNGIDKELEASWITSSSSQDLNIYKHAYIDCLDSASVADSSSKYNSKTWGILYKIVKP